MLPPRCHHACMHVYRPMPGRMGASVHGCLAACMAAGGDQPSERGAARRPRRPHGARRVLPLVGRTRPGAATATPHAATAATRGWIPARMSMSTASMCEAADAAPCRLSDKGGDLPACLKSCGRIRGDEGELCSWPAMAGMAETAKHQEACHTVSGTCTCPRAHARVHVPACVRAPRLAGLAAGCDGARDPGGGPGAAGAGAVAVGLP